MRLEEPNTPDLSLVLASLTLSLGGFSFLCSESHLGCTALVAEELGVNAVDRGVSLAHWLLDSVSVGFSGLVVCGMVL